MRPHRPTPRVLIFLFLRRFPGAAGQRHTFPASPAATSRSSGLGGKRWELCALLWEPPAPGIYLPPLPADDPPSLGHPRSFPIPSFVYKTNRGFGRPAVALAVLCLGEGRVQVCPSPLVGADLSDRKAHGGSDRRAPPPRWGRGEEQGLGLGKEAGRQLQCRAGCARVCQRARRLPAPATLRRAGQARRQPGARERRPSPRPRLRRAPRGAPGRGARGGAHDPAALAAPAPSPLSFPCTGAHQWSCSGMHTQLATGGG